MSIVASRFERLVDAIRGRRSKQQRRRLDTHRSGVWRQRLVEQLEARQLLATIVWGNENGGNWGVATNWVGGVLPGANDDVIIPEFAGSPTITFNSGTITVKSLEINESFVIAGGTFAAGTIEQIAGSFTLSSGTFRNSTLASGTLDVTGTVSLAGLEVGAGAEFVAQPTARIQVNTGSAVTVFGEASFQAGSRLTLDQWNGNSYSELVIGSGGVVTASGATFAKSGNWSDRTRIVVNDQARLIADSSTFSVETVELKSQAIFEPGDWSSNSFDSSLFVPHTVIPLLSAADGGSDNIRFRDIYIADAIQTIDTLNLRAIGTQTTTSLRYVYNGNFTVAAGKSLEVFPTVRTLVLTGRALIVDGQASFGTGSSLTLDQWSGNSYSELVIGTGGVVTASGATFSKSGNWNDRTRIVANDQARLIANGSTFSVETVELKPLVIFEPGDFSANSFDTSLFVPHTVIPLLSAADGGSDNVRFRDIYIGAATQAIDTLNLRAIGTETTANLRYVFNGSFTVAAGKSLEVFPTVRTLVLTGRALIVDGQASFGTGSSLTLDQWSGNSYSELVIGTGGVVTANGATFSKSGNWNDRTRIVANDQARLIANGSTFSVETVELRPQVIFEPGDLSANSFDTSLFVPHTVIPLLSAVDGGSDNVRFRDIYIGAATQAIDTLNLRAIGTETTANLRYIFNGNFNVGAGQSLEVFPTVRTLVLTGRALIVDGQASFGTGSSLTLDQWSGNSYSELVIGTGGVVTASGATFAKSGNWNDRTRIVANDQARLIANGSTFSVETVELKPLVIFEPGDFSANSFDTSLFVPHTVIPLLSAADGGSDNVRFRDIYIGAATQAIDTLNLRAIGTETTANLRYIFNGNFTVGAGQSLEVFPTVRTLVLTGRALIVDGEASFGTGSSLTLDQWSGNNYSELIIGSGGVVTASGATFAKSGNWNNRTRFVVNDQARLTADSSVFSVETVELNSQAIFEPGDWSANSFDTSLFVPHTVIPLLSAADGGSDNIRFRDIYIGAATQAIDTLNLRAIGTETTANLRYIFNGNFTVGAGQSLEVFPTVRTVVVTGRALIVDGQASFETGSSLALDQWSGNSYSELIVGSGGVVTASGATFSKSGNWNNRTRFVVNDQARLTAEGSTFSVETVELNSQTIFEPGDWSANSFDTSLFVPHTVIPLLSAADGGSDNIRFRDIYIGAATQAFDTLNLRAIGTETTANLRYIFNGNFTVGAGQSLEVFPTVRTVVVTGRALIVDGQASFETGSSLTLDQWSGNSYSELIIGSGGVVTASGVTFAKSGNWNNRTRIVVNQDGDFHIENSSVSVGRLEPAVGAGVFIQVDDGSVRTIGAEEPAVVLNNLESIDVRFASTLQIPQSVRMSDLASFNLSPTSTFSVTGSLLGRPANSAEYFAYGRLLFNANGNFETLGEDLGNTAAGFAHSNYAVGTFQLAASRTVTLAVPSGNPARALYVNTLIVPSGSTLNLNGNKVYARSALIDGNITNGNVEIVNDGGPIQFATPTPGTITQAQVNASQPDAWTFVPFSTQPVQIQLNPGSGGSNPPLAPPMQRARVELLNAANTVIAFAENSENGAPVYFQSPNLVVGQTYTVRVRHLTGPGNYMLTVMPPGVFETALGIAADPASITQAEGNTGTTTFRYNISRYGDLSQAESVDWGVSGTGSDAANAADFVGNAFPSGSVQFAVGENVKLIEVQVAADLNYELNETFSVTLSNPSNRTFLATPSVISTIFNDDAPEFADLIVGQVTPSTGVESGQDVTIAWQESNIGAVTVAGVWATDVTVTHRGTGQVVFQRTTSYTNNNLVPQASVNRSLQFTLPDGLAGSGIFDIEVTVDSRNQIPEQNILDTGESNNTTTTSFTSSLADYPELLVEAIDVNETLELGVAFDLGWTVRNSGTAALTQATVDRVYLSSNDQLDASDLLLNTQANDSSLPLGIGGSYSPSVSLTLPADGSLLPGSYFLLVVSDATNVQFELDEANNVLSRSVAVVHPPLPDLQVVDITAPELAVAGQSIMVSWELLNAGLAPATGQWRDRVYLSDDDLFGNDILLGTFPITTTLAPNESIERTQELPLPANVSGGYRIIVRTDLNNTINEGDGEQNNILVDDGVLTIDPRPSPNLRVESVTALTSSLFSGQAATVEWLVTNSGNASTNAAGWFDRVYISDDAVLSSDDVSLGTAQNPSYLNPGERYRSSLTVTLPEDAVGTRYFIVVTDAFSQLVEVANEHDNVTASPASTIQLTPPPDLIVTDVVRPNNANEGEPILVSWTVRNDGIGTTRGGQWTDQVYLSLGDKSLDAEDFLLATRTHQGNLAAGTEYTVLNYSVLLPENISSTEAYIIVRTDAGGQIYEHFDESNNATSSEFPMNIFLRPRPDLAVQTIANVSNAVAGQPLRVQYEVANLSINDTRQNQWQDAIYLSTDQTLDANNDLLLGYRSRTGVLLGNQSESHEYTFTLPNTLEGQFYILVHTDSSNVVPENDDANNIRSSTSAVNIVIDPPDLLATAIGYAGAARAGRPLLVNYSVKNDGNSPTPIANWFDAIYLSQDNTLDATDVLVDRRERTGVLQPGATQQRELPLTLPSNWFGNGFLIVHSDSYDRVFELDNANNILATSISVQDERPDLQVSSFVDRIDEWIAPGKSFSFDYTVRNTGLGATYGQSWRDRLILSSDGTLGNSDDRVLATYTADLTLPVGGSYARNSVTVTVPASTAEGTYRLFFVTDATGVVPEGNESNNFWMTDDFEISSTPPDGSERPDLRVTSITAPTTLFSGEVLDVAWTTINDGIDVGANQTWRDDVWLSLDQVLDASDQLLGRRTRYGGLVSSASYSQSLQWQVPRDMSGDYFIIVDTDASNSVVEGTAGEANNRAVSSPATRIELVPSADLTVGQITVPDTGFSGREIQVSWTIDNAGTGVATAPWADTVYLSLDAVLDRSTDIPLGFRNRTLDLNAGGSYTTTADLLVPIGVGGEYHLLVVTDSTNRVDERDAEGNNLGVSTSRIAISHLPPVDLVAGDITIPADTPLGAEASITFTISNAGDQTARGGWYDAVYISADDQWDIDDGYVGRLYRSADLAPQGEYTATLTAPLPGVLPGDYKVIIRSDIRNNVSEGDEENNLAASLDAFTTDAQALELGVPVSGTLATNRSVYYRVDVPAGETLAIEITSPSGQALGVTELYASYGTMPRRSRADFAALSPLTTDQRIVIASTEGGTYYIMAHGQSFAAGTADYSIVARIVPFSVFDSDYGQGGTAGTRTLPIDGAKFDRTVTAELVSDEGVSYDAVRYTRASSTRLYATFDLTSVPRATYTLRLTKASTQEVFEVPAALDVVYAVADTQPLTLTRPDSFNRRRDDRPPAEFPVTLAWKNTTLNDVPVPLIHFSATDPFAITREDANEGRTLDAIEFLGYAPGDGPRDVLLVGDYASATFYVKPRQVDAATPPQDIHYVAEYFYEDAGAEYIWDYDLSQLDLSYLSDDDAIALSVAFKNEYGNTLAGLRRALTEGLHIVGPMAEEQVPAASRQLLQAVFDRFAAGALTSLTGQLRTADIDVRFEQLVLTLTHTEQAERVYSEAVAADGSFVFPSLEPGSYRATLSGGAVQFSGELTLGITAGEHAAVTLPIESGEFVESVALLPKVPVGTSPVTAPVITLPGEQNELLSGNVLDEVLNELSGIEYRVEIVGGAPDGFTLDAAGNFAFQSTEQVAFVVHYDLVLPDAETRVGQLFGSEIRSRGAIAITLKENFTRDLRALDPNDIIGPRGYGDERWVSATEDLHYTIRYENDPRAALTAAQTVTIEQVLDEDLDLNSFRFGSFKFGEYEFEVPSNRQSLNFDLDLVDEIGIIVRMFARLDFVQRKVTWQLSSISPETGDETTNPDDGFLPINFTPPEGDGFVSYTVRAKDTAETGSLIHAQARIIFDANVPIDTPQIFNTLDATRPASAVTTSETTLDDRLQVIWSGDDGLIGAGLAKFDVFVSVSGGRFEPWLTGTELTSAEFLAAPGRTYEFVTLASDNVGNREDDSKIPDASRPIADAGGPFVAQEGVAVGLTGNGSDPLGGELQYEWDIDYDGLTFDVDATGETPNVVFGDGPGARTVALRVRSNVGDGLVSVVSTTTVNIENVPPSVSVVNAEVNGYLQLPLENSGLWNDVPGDEVSVTASLGDVEMGTNGNTWTWSYVGDAILTDQLVTITATDKDGGSSTTQFQINVQQRPVTSTLMSSATSVQYGQAVTFTVEIASLVAPEQIPSGMIQFQIDGNAFGEPIALVDGAASIEAARLPAGVYSVTAIYTDTSGLHADHTSQAIQQTVTKAPLTVRANDAQITLGDPLPEFTVTYVGFLPGENAAGALTGAPQLSVSNQALTAAGVYPIEVTVGTLQSANYSFNFVAGELTVVDPIEPALSLTPSTAAISESSGFVDVTLTRNTGTETALTVTLSADIAGIINFPASRIIPAGESSITFRIEAIDNPQLTIDRVVRLTASAQDFQASSLQLTVLNDESQRPVAITGGPYTALEGVSLQLNGSGTDPLAGNLVYEWDLNYDGTSFDIDATGASPSVLYSDGPGTRTYGLRVRSNAGNSLTSIIATTTVTIQNVAPTLSVEDAVVNGYLQMPSENSGLWSDVPNDNVELSASLGSVERLGDGTWTWSYDGSSLQNNQTVTITATDKDGGSSTAQFQVNVQQRPVTSTLVTSASSVQYGQPVTFTIDVVSQVAAAQIPTGLIQFQVAGISFGEPVALVNGSASILAMRLPAGVHEVRAIFTDASGLYAAHTSQPIQQTVTKAPLFVRAVDAQMILGEPLPPFSADYDGFLSGDNPANSLVGSPQFSVTNEALQTAGTYPIDVSAGEASAGGLQSSNYSFSFVAGELTVIEPVLTLTPSTASISENSGFVDLTLERNTSTANLLNVALTVDIPGFVNVPASVVIPAGQSGVTFRVQAIDNPQLLVDRTVQLTATASGLRSSTVVLTVLNDDSIRPVAMTGGPYVAREGIALLLSGSGSDPQAGVLQYEWDLNYDGTTFDVDATTASPTFIHGDGPAARTVGLRVRSSVGNQLLSTIATTVIDIENVPPTVSVADAIVSGYLQLPLANSGTWSDVPGDGVTLEASLGDVVLNATYNSWTWSYVGDSPLTDQLVTITATDKDGGSATAQFQVNVLARPVSSTLETSASSVQYGESVTFTIDVASLVAPEQIPVGRVQFQVGGNAFGEPVTLIDGVASIQAVRLPAGVHDVRAIFTDPSGLFAGHTSQVVQQTVTQAPLSVRAVDAQMLLGDPLPQFTANYNGFLPGDNVANSLSGTPHLSVPNGALQSAGVHPIEVAVGTLQSQNYHFSFVAGQLTVIVPALNLVRSVASISENSGFVDITVERNTATSNALTVGLTVDLPGVVTIPTNTIIPAGESSVTFRVQAIDNPQIAQDRVIRLTATAQGLAPATVEVTVLNDDADRPVALTGGPYTALEGVALVLAGTGTDPLGGVLQYEWDTNYDGMTFDVDATGAAPSISFDDGPGQRTFALRVRSSLGNRLVSTLATTTVDIQNVAPTISAANAVVNGHLQLPLQNSGSWSDVAGDEVRLTASLGTVERLANGGWTWSYVADQVLTRRTVTITATDKDGGSSTAQFQINVQQRPVTSTLVTSASSVQYGQAVTFRLDVSSSVAAGQTPTGVVQFQIGGTAFGAPVTLVAGVASIQAPRLPAGVHQVRAIFTDASGLYASHTSQVVQQTVSKAPLTVRANNVQMFLGESLPDFSATYVGFLSGDNATNSLSGTPQFTVPTQALQAAGEYPINVAVGGLQSANYSFSFVAGELTVVQPALTLTLVSTEPINENGGFVDVTLERNTPTNGSLTVALSVDISGVVNVPASVIIPSGQSSLTFRLQAIDNVLVAEDKLIRLTASAVGFEASSVQFTVVNDDNWTWTNPSNRFDVNDDGVVSPLDILLIVNYINANGAGQLPPLVARPRHFLDVSGDSIASPLDILRIVNFINSQGQGEGEGPDAPSASVPGDSAAMYFDSEGLEQKKRQQEVDEYFGDLMD